MTDYLRIYKAAGEDIARARQYAEEAVKDLEFKRYKAAVVHAQLSNTYASIAQFERWLGDEARESEGEGQ
jgi:hypothetical protein